MESVRSTSEGCGCGLLGDRRRADGGARVVVMLLACAAYPKLEVRTRLWKTQSSPPRGRRAIPGPALRKAEGPRPANRDSQKSIR